MVGPTPIQTRYKGYRFRSRLEARWAVFFDALGVRWEYEHQGYVLPSGPYLPDFWLPDWGVFGEVKPTPDAFDWTQAEELAEVAGRDVVALVGTPEIDLYEVALAAFDAEENGVVSRVPASREWIDFAMSAHKNRLWYFFGGPSRPPQGSATDSELIERAVAAARGARFEHGETGRV